MSCIFLIKYFASSDDTMCSSVIVRAFTSFSWAMSM